MAEITEKVENNQSSDIEEISGTGTSPISPTPAPETSTKEQNTAETPLSYDEIVQLVSDMKDQNEQYILYVQSQNDYFVKQSRNIFSISVLLVLAVGFASGILLARMVWRKI